MNKEQQYLACVIESGMQKAYVQILHAIIKGSTKNPYILAEADRILADSNNAYDSAKKKALEM